MSIFTLCIKVKALDSSFLSDSHSASYDDLMTNNETKSLASMNSILLAYNNVNVPTSGQVRTLKLKHDVFNETYYIYISRKSAAGGSTVSNNHSSFKLTLTPFDGGAKYGKIVLYPEYGSESTYYVPGSWGQAGTLLSDGSYINDTNSRCNSNQSSMMDEGCDLLPGSSRANRIRILGMPTQVSVIRPSETMVYKGGAHVASINGSGAVTFVDVIFSVTSIDGNGNVITTDTGNLTTGDIVTVSSCSNFTNGEYKIGSLYTNTNFTLLNSNGAPVNSIAVETSPNACIIEKTMLAVLQSGKKAYISSASSNACNFPVGEYKIDSVLRSVGMPIQILLTHANGTAIENFPSDTSSSNCEISQLLASPTIDVCGDTLQGPDLYNYRFANSTAVVVELYNTISGNLNVTTNFHVSLTGTEIKLQAKRQGEQCAINDTSLSGYLDINDTQPISLNNYVTFSLSVANVGSETISASWSGSKTNAEIAAIIKDAFLKGSNLFTSNSVLASGIAANEYPYFGPDQFCMKVSSPVTIRRPQTVEIGHKDKSRRNMKINLEIAAKAGVYIQNLKQFEGNTELPTGYSSYKASAKTIGSSSTNVNGGWATILKPGRNVYHMKPSSVTSADGVNVSPYYYCNPLYQTCRAGFGLIFRLKGSKYGY